MVACMHDTMRRFYEAIGFTKAYGKTQELAKRIGLENASMLSNWEKRGISADGLTLIQKAYGINATYLQTGDGPTYISGMVDDQPKKLADIGYTPPATEARFTPLAEQLAKLLDRIPDSDVVRKSIAYAQASQAIVNALQGDKPKD